MNQSPYCDHSKYANAHKQFDNFMKTCTVVPPVRREFGEFRVSTITCVSSIAGKVDIQKLFELLELSENIVYAKYSNKMKGSSETTKESSKSKNKKNQLFSNQMSIGFQCTETDHVHKNPISVKVFRNGRIQMTGCKNIEEIRDIYETLYKRMKQLETTYPDQEIADTIIPYQSDQIQIEMINGTFYMNHSLDLAKVLHVFTKHYTHEEVFVSQNKKSPLNFCIKSLMVFDEKKSKDKTPSVFIYNTGAINIIATKKKILYETYQFMKSNLSRFWDEIVQKKINLGEVPDECV